jgi:hypothetical protein
MHKVQHRVPFMGLITFCVFEQNLNTDNMFCALSTPETPRCILEHLNQRLAKWELWPPRGRVKLFLGAKEKRGQ